MVKVNGMHMDWREGMTIADLLSELGDEHNCPVIRMGHKIVTGPSFHRTQVPDGVELHLLHLVAGG
jgi:thiamine biosynthesis protein ThiS